MEILLWSLVVYLAISNFFLHRDMVYCKHNISELVGLCRLLIEKTKLKVTIAETNKL